MEIAVRGRHIEVPDEVRHAATEKVARAARHVGGMDRAVVKLREVGNCRCWEREVCEVTMHGHGHVVRARAAGPDWSTAVDRSVDKLTSQLIRLKGRLHHGSRVQPAESVHSEVSAEGAEIPADEEVPRIMTTKRLAMKPMTPEDAALHMRRLGYGFYVFLNVENGSTGVVFRRTDGHIGLIESG